LFDPRFLELLLRIDHELAAQRRVEGCRCGGTLHRADYPRKPRGCSREVRSDHSSRLSFCCSICRGRADSSVGWRASSADGPISGWRWCWCRLGRPGRHQRRRGRARLLACGDVRWRAGVTGGARCYVKHEAIAAEAALDGIYVIRTSVDATRMDSADCVRNYKALINVERAFRSLKTVDLKIRPIHHHAPDRVRAHILLCMLA